MHEEEEEETLATGKTGSGIVRIGFRVLVVRDAAGSSCDALTLTLSRVVRIVELDVLGSLDAARAAFAERGPKDAATLVLSCLDLPPAPRAGALAAAEADLRGLATILVTRSKRWIPEDAARCHELAWLPPDAGALSVADAIDFALRRAGELRERQTDGLAWRRAGA
ncbi:MAG TPA: hypothetical protein VL400_19100 [Polyangiaceae bacterium]|jgi:hypothetical protein|nr:hypothetical protein [Polyangiaceae bacterium]